MNKPDLTRLLKAYWAAGLGGVEVTSIYGVKGQEVNELSYLSPSWVEMLKHTCLEAQRLDMGVDLPPGSGWRIGGATVPAELASANLVSETYTVHGGESLRLAFATALPQAVVAYSITGKPVHLTGKIDAAGSLHWQAPTGVWTVYVVSQKFSGSKVKRPGPGGGGNSINPFSQRSLEAGLKPFDYLFAHLPAGAIRAQFHDSYEYEGNWTEEVFREFLVRCGYDLRDHLPALIDKGESEESRRVRNDYRHLLGELFLERMVLPWTEQAHRHGQLARNQGHGSPGNLLDLYAAADIPETEVFGADRAPLMAMFASSAAHIMGCNLVSSETGTWLAEHFTETLAELKAEIDMLFCSGINHIFYHGTAYSPASAAWPGWLFYASTEMNPNNPIWRDAPALNAYITRCQSLLQAGKPDNDVLLYWPERDVWDGDATHLLRQLTVHKRAWFEKEPFGESAKFLVENGYRTDFISDRQIAKAKVDGKGGIEMPGGTYRVIVVPPCRTIPLETMQRLVDLAHAGATVLFEKEFPNDVPGLGDLEGRRAKLNNLVALMRENRLSYHNFSDANAEYYQMGRGKIVRAPNIASTRMRNLRETLTEIHGLAFQRRREANGICYFISNAGLELISEWMPLFLGSANAQMLDPMTGGAGTAATRPGNLGRTEVFIELLPGQCLFIKSRAEKPATSATWKYWRSIGERHDVKGEWNLDFLAGGPELPLPLKTSLLLSWTQLGSAEMQRFAGTGRYTLRFDWPHATKSARLDLGKVCQSARVRLNGKELGALLSSPFQIVLDGLKRKDNLLEIEVTSVAANRIRDLDRRGVDWKIFKDINFVSIDYKPFNAAAWPLTDCGLLGPVTLQAVELWHP